VRILLTFSGFHDPYCASVVDGTQQAGPIMSMLIAHPVDAIVLFNTPGAAKYTSATVAAVQNVCPQTTVQVKDLSDLNDPTNHVLILRHLRRHCRDIMAAHPDAELFISIASGTPSMHACWLLLVAEGTLPAHILYGHPPRTAEEVYKVTEVNLSADEFPDIRPKDFHPSAEGKEYLPELSAVCEELQIIGNDKGFVTALDRAARLAEYDCHVLVVGETGTGKEQIARLIHRMSGRRKDRFVAVNCAAMPKELAESILFGHERGAFTGAAHKQTGEFLHADGGTLFLDEVGDMPSTIQAKLLRVLQDGSIKPLGGQERNVDVRVVAATNLDLAKAIREGRFRADLAQRFIDTVELPPLRRRRGDIVKLATFALTVWNREYGESRKIRRDALEKLQAYAWPGNVRELISAIHRAAMTVKSRTISADDVRLGDAAWQTGDVAASLPEPGEGFLLKDYLNEARASLVKRAIDIAHGNYARAARLLGISPQAVHKHARMRGAHRNSG
jgi:DNA-binding NtrC family response regulator